MPAAASPSPAPTWSSPTAASSTYEAATSHNVQVRVTDSAGNTYTKTLTVALTDVAEDGTSRITGTAAAETVRGTAEADIIYGGTGADTIYGGAGDDFIFGGDENDKLYGEAGNDTLDGGIGSNTLDGGTGIDTVSYESARSAVKVTLSSTRSQTTGGGGTDTLKNIENLTGSAFSDTLTGSSGNNVLVGLAGNDWLDGGAGADQMFGGFGNDTYIVDNAGDVVDESGGSGSDIDAVQSSVTFSLSDAERAKGSIENLTLTGSAAINGTGNALANTIIGNSGANIIEGRQGADVLDGGSGNDTLSYASSLAGVTVTLAGATASIGAGGDAEGDSFKNFENILGSAKNDTLTGDGAANIIDGGAGADAMAGGAGNDTYGVDSADDSITELAGGGTDLVRASISYTLGANLENLTLIGTGNINANGNEAANVLTGNSGNNRLDGGLGADTMAGGLGDDTYVVDNASDKVQETSGQGTDTIVTSLGTYSLANLSAVENVIYDNGAAADVNFTGTGNGLANLLRGGSGNDWLDGGAGADQMFGGFGNDTYMVDNAGDVVDESGGSGSDIDTVQSSVTFSLSDAERAKGSIENLTLTGSAAINGTGNALANTIIGNSGANIIEGRQGADVLDGGSGNDTLSYALSLAGVTVTLAGATASIGAGGDAEGDSFKNFENILGSAKNDTLTGDGAANIIDGGAGADAMAGGAGNDTYGVDSADDSITELAGGGTDLVRASISYTLGANLENLTLIGTGNINANGNEAANVLTGNSGNNRLDGGLGADTMAGGLGDDTYVVDNASDKVQETSGQGTDTIVTSLGTYSLANLSAVENLIYDNGAAADVNFTGTGNGLANILRGGSGNDKLNGGSGNDLLSVAQASTF